MSKMRALVACGVLIAMAGCSGGGGGTPAGGPVPPPAGMPQISLSRVAGGFASPVHVTHAGDGSGRIFVVEQGGRIRILDNGAVLPASFLDLASLNPPRLVAGGEQGLLSVAFPPGFAAKGYFYVNYTRAPDGATVVARYRVSAGDANAADPASEEVILTVSQPFANHNGGQLAFGPDGYLYIGMGDGGSGGDPLNNGQTSGTPLGKLLRIDVESGAVPYGIPPTNPFLGVAGYLPEIWALGLRNPWRFSFDRGTGDLYIGDVGQANFEEIDFHPAGSPGGQNYGWNIMEGDSCYPPGTVGCNRTGLSPPGLRVRSRARVLRDRRPCVPRFGDPLPAGGVSLRGPLQHPDLGDQEERRRLGQRAACGQLDVDHNHLRRRRAGKRVRGELRERRPPEDPFPVRP